MENEVTYRLGFFLVLYLLFTAVETLIPKRTRSQTRIRRWSTNWGLIIIDSFALRAMALLIPLLAVGAALDAADKQIGLFNNLDWNIWVEAILVILIFDVVIWFQHLITHKIPILWRLHRVHHSDRDMDVTTAIRFHPIEILLSMLLKIGLVYILGPAAWAVVAFEIILNGTAMFNHANIKLSPGLDRIVRKVMVTPDMHRIHHSSKRSEHDSNYGFSISLWDRVFRTYIDDVDGGDEAIKVGLQWQDDAPGKLGWSLMLPFFRK
jgi:sterol desaturase/sphingolipid hydroxylase (fatty acid hydroxylase superfamily)